MRKNEEFKKLPTTREDRALLLKDFKVMVLSSYIFAIIFFAVITYLIFPFDSFLEDNGSLVGGLIILAIVVPVFTAISVWVYRRYKEVNSIWKYQVEGIITEKLVTNKSINSVSDNRNKSIPDFYFIVEDHKFKVDIKQYGKFKEGDNVILNFTTKIKFVFNIELVE